MSYTALTLCADSNDFLALKRLVIMNPWVDVLHDRLYFIIQRQVPKRFPSFWFAGYFHDWIGSIIWQITYPLEFPVSLSLTKSNDFICPKDPRSSLHWSSDRKYGNPPTNIRSAASATPACTNQIQTLCKEEMRPSADVTHVLPVRDLFTRHLRLQGFNQAEGQRHPLIRGIRFSSS